jgi:hypothetical protein
MRIPARFKLGAKGIADRCGWVLRKTDTAEFYNVALRENYERRAPSTLRARKPSLHCRLAMPRATKCFAGPAKTSS